MSRWRDPCLVLLACVAAPIGLTLGIGLGLPARQVGIVIGLTAGPTALAIAAFLTLPHVYRWLRRGCCRTCGTDRAGARSEDVGQSGATGVVKPAGGRHVVVHLPRHRRAMRWPRQHWGHDGIDVHGVTDISDGLPVDQLVVAKPVVESVVPDSTSFPLIALDRRVFVVHGRDLAVQRCAFEFLRSLNLWPMDWEDVVRMTGSVMPYLLQAVEQGIAHASAVVVLLTPDDVVRLHPDLYQRDEHPFERQPTCQPRPNVLLELGIARGVCPERTIVIEIGQMRPIADLQGLNVIRFDGSVASLQKIAQRLKAAGCAVADQGIDRDMLARFNHLRAHWRRPA
jgi:predicted nucleotide-binding protein